MFRKLYKEANDDIKVDNDLLEKTLAEAFSEKSKKRVYNPRYFSTVAAAVVLVVGVSMAYPELVNKPVTETTTVTDIKNTSAPVDMGGDFIIAATDKTDKETSDAQAEEAQAVAKPQETEQSVNKPSNMVSDKNKKSEQRVSSEKKQNTTKTHNLPKQEEKPMVADNSEPEPANASAPNAAQSQGDEQVAVVAEPAGGEIEGNEMVNEEHLPSKARMVDQPQPSAYTPPAEDKSYELVSVSYGEGGDEIRVYENNGVSFTLSIKQDEGTDATGVSFVKSGKRYTLISGDMSLNEFMEVCNKLGL